MHSGTAYIISNILLTFMWMIAGELILDSRYSKVFTVFAESVIQLMFWVAFYYLELFSVFRVGSGILCLILLMHVFHTDRPLFKMITALMIFAATFCAEVILGAILPYDMIISGEIFAKYDVAVYSLYQLLCFTFLSVLTVGMRTYKQRYKGLLVDRQWFLFALFPLSQTITTVVFWPAYLKANILDSPYKVLAMTIFNILADIALIYAFRATTSNTELRIRSEILEDQVRSQADHCGQPASTYAGIRKMRHDIDNHIYAIKALLNNNEPDKAADYIRMIEEEDAGALRLTDCRNTVISSYLEKKLMDLERDHI